MMYKIEFSKTLDKDLKKITHTDKILIFKWIEKNLQNTIEPRLNGKSLKGKLSSYWRYRVGKYRIIVEIKDDKLIVLLLNVATRGSVYKK